MMISKRIEYIELSEVKKYISPDLVKTYSFLNVKYSEESVEVSYRAFYFVELALREYQHFGDDHKLLKAVEFGVIELLSEDYREDFLKYINHKNMKGKVGISKNDDPNILVSRSYIWKQTHYHMGQGLRPHATDGALALASEKYGSMSLSTAKKRYKEAQALLKQATANESSPNKWRLTKDVYFRMGRIDKVKEIIDKAIKAKKGKEHGINLACEELGIERNECLNFYKK